MKLYQRTGLLATLALALLSFSFRFGPQGTQGSVTYVVIDPGHGGRDPGALGKIKHEKDLTLRLSLAVEKLIKKNAPHVKIELTRRTDKFVRLADRAEVANKHGADLFISIHYNAANSSAAHGTETFAMGTHKNDGQLDVMIRENSAILLEENHEETYNGFDPTSEEATIIFKLQQHAFLKQSLQLAALIEDQMKAQTKRSSRGVKQAGFLVLWRTTMPAVLFEGGFISNAAEEKFVNSAEGLRAQSMALYRAIMQYRNIDS